MKFTKLEIKDFNQFKDLVIDLTYPAGHEKAGQPLEKVCFIGQSGTGKTTLLKLLKGYQYSATEFTEEFGHENVMNKILAEVQIVQDLRAWIFFTKHPNPESAEINVGWCVDGDITYPSMIEMIENVWNGFRSSENIPAEINLPVIRTIYVPADAHVSQSNAQYSGDPLSSIQNHFDFGKISAAKIWETMLSDIATHQQKESVYRNSIAELAMSGASADEIGKINKELSDINKKEHNPITRIAEDCFNPVLHYFNLRVKTKINFQNQDDTKFIKIEDLQGNEIPNGLLSTGTNQILLSVLPLYLLKPNQTIILYDEPERSLYPDMQRRVIDLYTSLAVDSQFFFATHSPIIASCFEPWEIVELKFNEEGHVYQELYYPADKERHVDNYTIVPAYLTYDLMLRHVFDMKETTSNERAEKITEVLMLRDQLKEYKKQGKSDTPEAKALFEEYSALAGKLFWEFDTV